MPVISSFLGSCQDADAEGESSLAPLIQERVCRIADLPFRALGRLVRPSILNLLLGTGGFFLAHFLVLEM